MTSAPTLGGRNGADRVGHRRRLLSGELLGHLVGRRARSSAASKAAA
jgi:hypothetical protein